LENGYIEGFNGKLRDECLNGELFLSLAEARYVVDNWRLDYNPHGPHSRLDWMTPATFSVWRRRWKKTAVYSSGFGYALPSGIHRQNDNLTLMRYINSWLYKK
jgi:hypothetical protein